MLIGKLEQLGNLSGRINKSGGKESDLLTITLKGNIGSEITPITSDLQYIDFAGLYTIIDYLEFDGTHYIDTEYKPNNNTLVKAKFTHSAINKFLYGSRSNSTSNDHHAFNAIAQSIYPMFGSFRSTVPLSLPLNTVTTLEQGQNGSYINEELIKEYDKQTFTGEYNMYLGGINTGGAADTARLFQGNIFYFAVYENNEIKRYMLPCKRKSDDKQGMMDLKNNIFYELKGAS